MRVQVAGRPLRWATACTAALICLAGLAGVALAGWSAPKTLSSRGGVATYPQVGVDRKGDAVAAWGQAHGQGSVVLISQRSRGHSWSRPVRVSPLNADSYTPQVAVAPSGAAVVVWENDPVSGSRPSFIEAVSRASRGARWRGPVKISTKGVNSYFPAAGIDASGQATAIWVSTRHHENLIQAATVQASRGGWSAPRTITVTGQELLWPQLALDGRGDAVAMWICCGRGSELRSGLHHIVKAAFRPAGHSSWQGPTTIGQEYELPFQGDGAFEFPGPRVAIDAHGEALIVWQHKDHGKVIAQAAFKSPGKRWQEPQPISNRDALEPHVGMDARGDAVVIWQGTNRSVFTATRAAGAKRWSAPFKLANAESAFDRYAHVAVDAGGEALATWSGGTIDASVRAHMSGKWTRPAKLGSGELSEPALDAGGQGWVVWQQFPANSSDIVIEAAGWG